MNDWYKFIKKEFPEQYEKMQKYGRRNCSFSTVAPTGTVSLMTATTSGIEPLFLPYYMRRKKINPNDKGNRIDFTDANGDNWQEFAILHPKFKLWLETTEDPFIYKDGRRMDLNNIDKEHLELMFKRSPWFGSTANDIAWDKRVEIQSIIQKYTTHSISSTINLPNNVSKEEVANIYKLAWKKGLKGVTVYRDGCRDGVLVSTETKIKEVAFSQTDATKRPVTLVGDGHIVTVKGVEYFVVIGILDEKPYEVFAAKNQWNLPKSFACTITKKNKGKYDIDVKDILLIEDFTSDITDEEAAVTRLISTSLRHGTHVKYVVEQLNKTQGNIVGFSKAIVRCMKPYLKNEKIVGETCDNCGSSNMIREEGCKRCLDCGSSKCG